MYSQSTSSDLSLPIWARGFDTEQVGLLARFVLEHRMNLREAIPGLLEFAVRTRDRQLFSFILSKSTPADVRDWIRARMGKVSSTWKELINEWLYSQPEFRLSIWLSRYGGTETHDGKRMPLFPYIFDVTHPNPSRWRVEWFQSVCYGATPPEDSLIAQMRAFRKSPSIEMAQSLLSQGVGWHYVAQSIPVERAPQMYLRIAGNARLILRHLETFLSAGLAEQVLERVRALERAWVNPAEIVRIVLQCLDPPRNDTERILRMELMSLATRELKSTFVDPDHLGNVLVVADKSGSMSAAIETALWMAGTVAARRPEATSLIFFDTGVYQAPTPQSLVDVLALQERYRAGGGTHLAPAIEQIIKTNPDTIVIVSDGIIFDANDCLDLLSEYSPPRGQRWYFTAIHHNPRKTALWDVLYKSPAVRHPVVIPIREARDHEAVLAIISLIKNQRLVAQLQGISEDLIVWTETSPSERPQVKFRTAIRCGFCGAPIPKMATHCLWCGSALE